MEAPAEPPGPAAGPGLSDRGAVRAHVSPSQEREARAKLREVAIYMVFLTDLCVLTFGMVSTDMYYLNRVMARLFVEPSSSAEDNGSGFRSIGSRGDFWRFAEGPLLDGLYWDKWYNNMTLTFKNNNSRIYHENLLLGVAQIRQLKVRHNTCSIYPYFRAFLEDCYSGYHYLAEDRSDFGLRNGSEWKYTSASSLSPWYWGSMGLYSSGGYLFTLPKSKQESLQKLVFLRENSWLTRATRVVFIDFSTYNANINLFCVIRLVVEFPATGGAFTSSHIYSVKLLRYVTYYDYFLASCEITFCLFIMTFVIQKAIQIVKLRKKYFRSAWNWLDLLLLVVSILAIAFNIYRTAKVSLLMEELLSDAQAYPDLYFLAFWQVLYNNMIAVNIFFAWIKVFKYVSINKTMTQLCCTLSRCAKDIIGFAIMFFIIFFAYAQLGYLVFGSQVEDFSTFQNCMYDTFSTFWYKTPNWCSFTQFRIILGDFDFEAIEAADRILGPIYFITFVFFVFFILLNMFLAILNDTYSAVKAEFEATPSQELKITDLITKSCSKALVKLKLKKPEMDPKPAGESLAREFPATRRKDISKLSCRDNASEKSHLNVSELQEWEEKRRQKYPSTEDTDAFTAQSYVSNAEFQRLLRYTAELVVEFNKSNAKLKRLMRSVRLSDASQHDSTV